MFFHRCKQQVISWGSREDVSTPSSPNPARDFAHHNGDELLHCPEAK
jgi:hypothetical protein